MGIKISAIVLAKNEEGNVEDCLKGLKWTDEIVVVDNGSVDKTAKRAKEQGARVFSSLEKSFGKRRELGAKRATGEWLFYVDADEKVTPALRQEVIKSLDGQTVEHSAFSIPRRNILLGREMKFGGWSPDYVLRLIRKSALKGYSGELHEQPVVGGKVGKLKEAFVHTTHNSLTEMVDKTNEWSDVEAQLLYKSGHPKMNIWRFFSAGGREFWNRGVKGLGFLDGGVGVIEIIYQVFNKMIVYAKLWEKQLQGGKLT